MDSGVDPTLGLTKQFHVFQQVTQSSQHWHVVINSMGLGAELSLRELFTVHTYCGREPNRTTRNNRRLFLAYF